MVKGPLFGQFQQLDSRKTASKSMQNQNNQKISEFRVQKFHTPKDSQDFKMVRFKYVTPGLAENKRFHTFTALTASTMI